MKIKHNEDTRVKYPATVQFMRLGYEYESFNKALSDGNIDSNTKIFKHHFKNAIEEINGKKFSDDEINEWINKIHNVLKNKKDLGREFYDWLIKPVDKIKLIDFDNIDKNKFHVVNELKFGDQEKGHFRPDINILINGMPLAFLEVKIPNNDGGIQEEFKRMINDRLEKDEHKKYFNMIQVTAFSNNMRYESDDEREGEPKAGSFYSTPNSKKTTFNFFREEEEYDITKFITVSNEMIKNVLEDNNENTNILDTKEFGTNLKPDSPCNKFVTSLFEKERFLYILKYGITYVKRAEYEKHIMRYPQFFATKAILRKLDNNIKRGIIWHTQGSGKTALSVYCNRILTDYYSKKDTNVQFYYVVDRLELLNQVSHEYEIRNYNAHQVNSKSEFEKTLKKSFNPNKKLDSYGSTVVVNIHKFSDKLTEIKNPYESNIQRVFFVDEAHRSYSKHTGEFYKNLMLIDRDAIFIALTGTPLLSKKERSNLRFGDYIHKYFYDKSILDGYTLKIKKEEMQTNVRAKIKEDLQIEKRKKDKLNIFELDEYITELSKYIEKDFKNFRDINGDSETKYTGAMIVSTSNKQARKIQRWFEKNSSFNTRLVISDSDISENNKTSQNDFKDHKNGIDILIVNLMLTTGYDVNRLKKMYLLRKPREHGLLQTISRVNRPYKSPDGRPYKYGYISDFVDITDEYDRTRDLYIKELSEDTIDKDGVGIEPDKLIFDLSSINSKYEKSLNELTLINPFDDMEIFNLNLTNDLNILLKQRRLINNILECKIEYQLSFNDKEANKIDSDKFKQLRTLVQKRIDFIRLTDEPVDIMSTYGSAIIEISFSFLKIRTTILDIKIDADNVIFIIRDQIEKVVSEVNRIQNKDDPRVYELDELLKNTFRKFNIKNMDDTESISNDLKNIHEKALKINEENDLLKSEFEGNFAYVKTIQDLLNKYNNFPFEKLVDILKTIKEQVMKIESINPFFMKDKISFKDSVKSKATLSLMRKGLYKEFNYAPETYDFILEKLFVNLQLY
ncbi:DEAD/DEAH box helicase family protein [Mycoplasmopsis agassizii]|uniref:type I site-specific deoxyribonuclease n=1 Tax=Mycoplasmopsis agassizii TaxID=33922 RepID=A0ABX4H5V8_9BACT|nr:DEAD/DEAH box helicase family protein [Mycoplasmopsis agassizii]PAF55238.1 type I restriction endonuclease subunit R [Mycoplasmopsis agassizii]SMC15657.1 type I restriction enzyme, R subunit [Mycoplasmopsis agassizii]